MKALELVAGSLVVCVLVACGQAPARIGPDPEADAGALVSDAAATIPVDAAGPAEAGVDGASRGPGGGTTYASNETTCGQSYTAGSVTYWYAEQLYPGATADELSGVTGWYVHAPDAGGGIVPGYVRASTSVQVRDGAVAVNCGTNQGLGVVFVRAQ